MKLILLCCRRKVVILTILRFLLLLASIWSLPYHREQSSSIQPDQYWLCYRDLLLTCVWLSQVGEPSSALRSANCGLASGYTFTLDASVVKQRNETVTSSCQSSVLFQSRIGKTPAETKEACDRQCDQLAQVLFNARGTSQNLDSASKPLRKTHLLQPHFTNLFGLQNNLQRKKADTVFELYQQYVEVFEGQ